MPYGGVKFDTITFTNAGADTTTTVSGLYASTTSGLTVTGTILAGSGSVAAPSHSFTNDPNTGLFNPAADTLAFAEGGTEAMRISDAGFVGIGTTSPSQLLHINNATGVARCLIQASGTTNAELRLQQTTGLLQFGTNASNAYIVDSVARDFTIDINGAERFRVNSTGQITVASSGTAAAPNYSFQSDPNTGIYSPAADTLAFAEGGVEAMRIDSSGRLLVGTSSTSISNRLQVNANAEAGGASFRSILSFADASTGITQSGTGAPFVHYMDQLNGSANLTAIAINRTNAPAGNNGLQLEFNSTVNSLAADTRLGRFVFSAHDGSALIPAARIDAFVDGTPGTNDMPGRLVFSTTADGAASPTERMRIDSSGRVGIGATSPLYSLESASSDDVQISLTRNSVGRWLLGTTSAHNLKFAKEGGAEAMRLDASSRVLVGITSANTSGAKLQTADGITFPATAVASADPNTLDDYEEGTWTPNVGGNATYNTQTGFYTKTGRMVVASFTLYINVLGTGSAFTVSGLPFAPSDVGRGGVSIYYWAALAQITTYLGGFIGSSASFDIVGEDLAATGIEFQKPVLGSGARIDGIAVFQIA